jgi:hypothetical protein
MHFVPGRRYLLPQPNINNSQSAPNCPTLLLGPRSRMTVDADAGG